MTKLKDAIPAAFNIAESDVVMARSRYEYLVKRRDEQLSKFQTGVLTVNAASLVAVLTSVGGKGEAAAWLGLDAPHARFAACAFTIGTIIAGISMWFDGERFRREAGLAVARLGSAERLRASYEYDEADVGDKLTLALEDHSKKELVDFQFSPVAIALQSIASGAWISGILYPLFKAAVQ